MRSISGILILLRGMPVHWKSSTQTVTSTSTCASETVAQSDLIVVSEEVHQIHSMLLRGVDDVTSEPSTKGPLYCDNRSTVLNAKKDDISDVPKKSRHVALRCQKVLEEGIRSIFTPTDMQLADGMTKSPSDGRMLFNILHPHAVKSAFLEKVKRSSSSLSNRRGEC